MPPFQNGDATIYYEVYGSGFPVLCFAPGGLMSAIDLWRRPMSPVNPIEEFSREFQVIVMDQRNAPGGRSHAPIRATDNWDSFTSDHVALLDHLGVGQCHLFGQCIGGPFIMNFLRLHQDRVACAVIVQPIGRLGELPPGRSPIFQTFVDGQVDHPEATEDVLDAFFLNLYGPGFAYSATRDDLPKMQTPCLVLAGNDDAHPFPIAEEMARLLPHSEFIPDWKTGQPLQEAKARMKAFLADHTPVRA